jgi:MbtH protein
VDTVEDSYYVVVNDEEQYSIWPGYHSIPAGWQTRGLPASREECLRRIDADWTDLRPKSVRERLARS